MPSLTSGWQLARTLVDAPQLLLCRAVGVLPMPVCVRRREAQEQPRRGQLGRPPLVCTSCFGVLAQLQLVLGLYLPACPDVVQPQPAKKDRLEGWSCARSEDECKLVCGSVLCPPTHLCLLLAMPTRAVPAMPR